MYGRLLHFSLLMLCLSINTKFGRWSVISHHKFPLLMSIESLDKPSWYYTRSKNVAMSLHFCAQYILMTISFRFQLQWHGTVAWSMLELFTCSYQTWHSRVYSNRVHSVVTRALSVSLIGISPLPSKVCYYVLI